MTINGARRCRVVDSAVVDEEVWHTVSVYFNSEIARWIRSNDPALWRDHKSTDNIIDVHEKLYTLMALMWHDRF